jgi:hypothetical protein
MGNRRRHRQIHRDSQAHSGRVEARISDLQQRSSVDALLSQRG